MPKGSPLFPASKAGDTLNQYQKKGKGGEIHITDAIKTMIENNSKFIGHKFSGKYLDCGSMDGYIKSTLEIAKL